MISMKSNFKGFVFTLDAFFALIVAIAGVSILLYAHFSSTLLYSAPPAEASSILQNLLQTSVLTASQGNVYARYLLNSWAGNAYSWPQFAHDQYHSSNTSYGPQAGYLLYSFAAAATITPVVAVDQGIAAFAAGTYLYAINAMNGTVINSYPLTSASAIPVAPVIYKNEIIYATASGSITAVSTSNSLLQLWSTSISAAATTPLEIENNYLAFGSSNTVYLLNPVNGTTVASVSLPASSQAQPPAYVNGEYIISTGSSGPQNYVYSYVLNGGTLTNVWSYTLTTSQTTQPVVNGSAIAVGSGKSLYLLTLSGSLIKNNMLPNAQIIGVASSPNNFYVETVNAIYSFTPTSNTAFSYPTQTDTQNSVPSASFPMLYTLVSGTNFQGYNVQTGLDVWNVSLPSSSSYTGYSNVALAYGNAYVANGKTLYVFGTYDSQPGDSLLQAMAGMYLNNQTAYANLMLNKIYNSTNLALQINLTAAPTQAATYDGATSYVQPTDSGMPMGNNPRSMFAWIYLTKNNDVYMVHEYGTAGASVFNEQSVLDVDCDINYPLCQLKFESYSNDFESSLVVPLNTWTFVGYTWNGITDTITVYDNGASQSSAEGSLNTVSSGSAYLGYPNYEVGNWFPGSMADVQIYNIALSPAQVASLYTEGIGGGPVAPSNLVGWWRLNGNFQDYSGNNNNGEATNVYFTHTQSPYPTLGSAMKAASFNGAGSQIVANVPNINSNTGGYDTASMWVYWTGGENEMPFSVTGYYDLWFDSNDLGFNTGCSDLFGTSSTGLANRWINIAAVFKNGGPISNDILYVNGVPQTSTQEFGTPCAPNAQTPIYLGSYDGAAGYYFGGLISDVQMYNTALKPSQIMHLYQIGMYGVPTNMTNLVGWWPLNGNSNDYSGYFDLGTPTSITYQNTNTLSASLKNAFEIGAATAPLSITSNGVTSVYNVSVISWR
jgi:hypothetical protein